MSPQKPLRAEGLLTEPVSYHASQLRCPDPGYKEYIPAELIRRMGRIIRMGVTASKICLKDAMIRYSPEHENPINPQAIITGTGLGCIEDTEKFLTSMIKNNEEFLTPTSFIQSTHNTVAGQIALLLKCHSYNFTYVQRGNSFESALIDAITQMKTGEFGNVLVGGFDELTQHSFAIMNRMGFWKRKPIDNLQLLNDHQRGTVAGEGAAFMFLEKQKHSGSYACLRGVEIFHKPASNNDLRHRLNKFLARHDLTEKEIGFTLLGFSGDTATDHFYHELIKSFPENSGFGYFKHLCGEYHTASSFASGLAALIMKSQSIPEIVRLQSAEKNSAPEYILIYNHFRGANHSFTLLSRP